jgi:phospholipase A-2-activating protein
VGFVSASHDQTLRVWTLGGDCIGELEGHAALVYSVAVSAKGVIASASEDNTAKCWWPDGTCLHPGEAPSTVEGPCESIADTRRLDKVQRPRAKA